MKTPAILKSFGINNLSDNYTNNYAVKRKNIAIQWPELGGLYEHKAKIYFSPVTNVV